MKKSLIIAALAPLTATAAGNGEVDREKLRSAVPATAILAEEVLTKDGVEAGDIEDIVMNRDGKVVHFLVDADLSKLPGGEERLDRDPGVTDEDDEFAEAEFEEAERQTEEFGRDVGEEFEMEGDLADRGQEADRAIDWMGEEFTPLKPRSVRYDEAGGEVRVEADALVEQAQTAGDSPEGMRVSEVIGMEVNLSDDDSFGRVEDVMISDDGSEVVALVVDNWDGLNKERRAMPVEDARFNYDEEEITYSLTEDQVEDIPEFNLDAYTEDGWDLSDWDTI